MDELFFVGIKDHLEVRKELLTSSKNIIDSLKHYENYKSVKEDKMQYVLELKRVFDELLLLNKKLRNKMPKVPVKIPTLEAREREEPEPRAAKEMPRKTPSPETRTKLELLEAELAKVEARLGHLE